MNFQPDQNVSRDDDDAIDHARLMLLSSRRAQKADTYRRIHLGTRPAHAGFGHRAG